MLHLEIIDRLNLNFEWEIYTLSRYALRETPVDTIIAAQNIAIRSESRKAKSEAISCSIGVRFHA